MNDSWNRRQFLIASGAMTVGTLAGTSLAQPVSAVGQEWWTWRGPNGNATCDEVISASLKKENMKWGTPIPGRGHASATVTADWIYLPTADKTRQTQSVFSINRADGKPGWTTVVHRGGLNHKNHAKNTEASCSLAYDGERLFAVFFNNNAIHLTTLDPQGNILAQKNLGPYNPQKYEYGYAASPTIYKDFVIISAEYELGSFLVALDRHSGQEVWRTKTRE